MPCWKKNKRRIKAPTPDEKEYDDECPDVKKNPAPVREPDPAEKELVPA